MGIKFEFLKVGNGDAILIKTEDCIIMIDSGEKFCFIAESIEKIEEENRVIDHFILTHVDEDHIKGFLEFIEIHPERARRLIKKVWFNAFHALDDFIKEKSSDTSISQGLKFEEVIDQLKINKENRVTKENMPEEIYLSHNIKIKIISPNIKKLQSLNKKYKREKESKDTGKKIPDHNKSIDELVNKKITKLTKDYKPANGSSIAFILTYKENKKFLFLGDAHIGLINESLNDIVRVEKKPIYFEFVKLSHHGSKGNLDDKFLSLVDTMIYVICTSGESHNHPDKETLARIINHNKKIGSNVCILFNYCENKEKMESYFSDTEREKYSNFKFLCEQEWEG